MGSDGEPFGPISLSIRSPVLDKRILITGGTGSLGRALIQHLLQTDIERLVVLSRDEWKQYQLAQQFPDSRLRCFLGDVRDVVRLEQAFQGVEAVIHAAALKRIDKVAYDPSEVLKTNVFGTQNVIQACVRCRVPKMMLISSDKAVEPTNIYGATKMTAEWLTVMGNVYAYSQDACLSVVRYGNVAGSRGSVIPLWKDALAHDQPIRITDERCSRFWITMQQAITLVMQALEVMDGGEVFVPKLPSFRLLDLAQAVAPDHPQIITELRPGGEKLHESLMNSDEVKRTIDAGPFYVINPSLRYWGGIDWTGEPIPAGFQYRSDLNSAWLTVEDLRALLPVI